MYIARYQLFFIIQILHVVNFDSVSLSDCVDYVDADDNGDDDDDDAGFQFDGL